jgi:hypothetical protein
VFCVTGGEFIRVLHADATINAIFALSCKHIQDDVYQQDTMHVTSDRILSDRNSKRVDALAMTYTIYLCDPND